MNTEARAARLKPWIRQPGGVTSRCVVVFVAVVDDDAVVAVAVVVVFNGPIPKEAFY